ncbi:MAG: nucleotidyl transferase AbiEii/AbiGii toxin family protein [Verrucomicrobiota bacterium]
MIFSNFLSENRLRELTAAPYNGARYPVEAVLDGRTFAKFHLDIGTGDVQRDPVELVAPRDWLGFAGVPTQSFPAIASEEHFAQKLHAYTLPRGEHENSRVKDLVDLILLIERCNLDSERLRRDLADTFNRRNTHPLPPTLKAPPNFWRLPFARMARECGINPEIDLQFQKVSVFYQPLHCP